MIEKLKTEIKKLEELAGWQGIAQADLFLGHVRLWMASIETRQAVIDADASKLYETVKQYRAIFEGPE